MDLYKEFATNPASEEEGIWEEMGDGAFLIARSHNTKFDTMITSLVSKNRKLLDSKSEAAKQKSEELYIDVMAKTILLGWRGDLQFKGAPLGDYTVAKAKELLAIKDFRSWVSSVSEDQSRFKAVQDEDDAGK